jgi:hypothetical protein
VCCDIDSICCFVILFFVLFLLCYCIDNVFVIHFILIEKQKKKKKHSQGVAKTRNDTDHEPLFRQESYFQYLFGVKEPDCFGILDIVRHLFLCFSLCDIFDTNICFRIRRNRFFLFQDCLKFMRHGWAKYIDYCFISNSLFH